jgi:hypothetical protein
MRRIVATLAVLVMTVLLAWPSGQAYGLAQATPNPAKVGGLDMTLRHLFVDHVFWVRSMVISTKSGNSDEAQVAYRMALDNAKAFGDAVASFYGQKAGDEFARLFADHVNAVKDYCLADLKSDEAAKNAAATKMSKNGEQLAALLSSANPNLPKSAVLSLLGAHVAQHIVECNAVAAGNFTQEAKTWDTMLSNIYAISDALAGGIAKQFPNKFM